MGILYYIYQRDFSRRYSTDLYKKDIYKIWSTNKDYKKNILFIESERLQDKLLKST